ncbi:hypothetical protein [Absidia glauca]|uniref:Uncharacterized protein n=1 Tax=Absidia glauca TaxID=4829 RepID=A0A163IW43_ABSGL|nr:hypothetical protein [Absidia glauca]
MKTPSQARQPCESRAPKEQSRQRSSNSKPLFKVPVGLSKKATCIPQYSTEPSSSSSSSSSPARVSSKVMAIANTMKTRMKAAVTTMLLNSANDSLHHAVSPLLPPPSLPPPLLPPPSPAFANVTPLSSTTDLQPLSSLKNRILLKQYLAFVEGETGSQMELDPSPAVTASTLQSQELYQSHPLASTGASLIELLVHQPSSSRFSGKLDQKISM